MRGTVRSLLAGLALLALLPAAADAKLRQPTKIQSLSNRADLVSDGNALVAINLPKRARRWKLKLTLGKRNVTKQIGVRSGLRAEALVTGLKNGKNTLTAKLRDGWGARLTLTNHPNGGPVFAGPQVQPWVCQDGAKDKQCNQPAKFTYFYKSTDSNKKGLQPYDPGHPASDVASTTTDGGVKVPFVIRLETGYQDRDQYKIATLYQPGKRWSWEHPQRQWNHKLLITHGASCGVDYKTGGAPSVMSYNPIDLLGLPVSVPLLAAFDSVEYALGHGFAVMSTALDNTGHHCDVVTQAESLMMAKEHLIEQYGKVRYTIGTGCSGGSLAQQWIANAYPGIYQGILPTCSFPDTWSSATQVMDYHLLRTYFESHIGSLGWLPTQWGPVEGNPLPLDAIISDIGFFSAIIPDNPCGGVTAAQLYNAQSNPGGVRCTVAELAVNVLGRRLPAVWSANERKLGHGFAGVPVDNVGVQYGLASLRNGSITPAQFVDLNAKVGGLSIDIQPTPSRIAADQPALANAYRSGMINETNNLNSTAIIDCRGPDPGAAHDSYRAFAVRARLDREHGTHANQAIWEGPAPIIGDAKCSLESLKAMDRWVGAIVSDKGGASTARKVARDKPKDLTDECYSGVGGKLSGNLCSNAIVPVYGTPRTVAGDGITTDANKCRLKPLRRADYPAALTSAQFAQLQATFPTGVCDYSQPAVSQQKTIPWLTYQNAKGRVIFGGRPMAKAPVSESFGCLSAKSAIGSRNIGRVRLRLTKKRLLRRLPGPSTRKSRSWRWCVGGTKGEVRAAFTKSGKVAVVGTTARKHGNRRLRPGGSLARLRAAYPHMRKLGHGIVRASKHSPRIFGVRRGKVRFIAVASRKLIHKRATLRRYLKLAGLR